MASFYSRVFGWKAQTLGEDMGNYVTVQTTEVGSDGFPKESGRINGGFFVRTKEDQVPSVVIAVDDIRDAMKKVAAPGGDRWLTVAVGGWKVVTLLLER